MPSLIGNFDRVQNAITVEAAELDLELASLKDVLDAGAKYMMHNEHVAIMRRQNTLRERREELDEQYTAITNGRNRAFRRKLPDGRFVPVEEEEFDVPVEELPKANKQRKVRLR